MTNEQREHIIRLIKEIAKDQTTSSVVGFIADNNGMLGACRELVKDYETGDAKSKEWLIATCKEVEISIHLIIIKIKDIVELFSSGNVLNEAYATLEVSADANLEEVKRAYRKLSLDHHPDTAVQDSSYDPGKFVEITRAYHAITDTGRSNKSIISDRVTPTWQQRKKRVVSQKQRNKVYIWASLLVVGFVIVSILSAVSYRNKIMIAGLKQSRGAFVPPTENKTIVLSAPYGTGAEVAILQSASSNSGVSRGGLVSKEENTGQKIDKPNIERVNSESLKHSITTEPVVNISEKLNAVHESKKHSRSPTADSKTPETLTTDSIDNIVILTRNPDTKRIVASPAQMSILSDNEEQQFSIIMEAKSHNNLEIEEILPTAQKAELAFDIILEKQVQVSSIDEKLIMENQTGNQDSVKNTSVDAKEHSVNNTTQTMPEAVESGTLEANKEFDLQQRIDQFIADYINAYNQKNALLFTSYFEENSYENDKPFNEMLPIYNELFKRRRECH